MNQKKDEPCEFIVFFMNIKLQKKGCLLECDTLCTRSMMLSTYVPGFQLFSDKNWSGMAKPWGKLKQNRVLLIHS